ncbi:DUF2254 domain-containing protein [Agrobacterium sp. ES01]|uniref:DUF2254 domain-containing protein n=1 Tax=Agrobacterium sp. ES01 TaxID=3420714 RepID=UPI003D0A7294
MSGTWWQALQVVKRLWFRATLYALVAVAIAVLGIVIGPYIPDSFSDMVGAKAVDAILSIIASSMLAVTTFSLSTLVAATTAAATSGTPRAISLLLQDRTAQSALSTFLGAFLFSLVGLIALNTHLYGGGGRLVLFVATLVVVLLIVTMLLRWIDHLAGLGQVSETISRVSDTAESALSDLAQSPYLGGLPYTQVPDGALPLFPDIAGHLRHVDMARLHDIAKGLEGKIFLLARPGDYCSPNEPLLMFHGPKGFGDEEDDTREATLRAFTLGDIRNYAQDPLFGLTVLSEIASRALSPGINDPGTALDVVSRLSRLMGKFAEQRRTRLAKEADGDGSEARYDTVYMPPVLADDLFGAAYVGVARDGAHLIEVASAVQQSLAVVAQAADPEIADAARDMARQALERSQDAMTYEGDWKKLDALHASMTSRSHLAHTRQL